VRFSAFDFLPFQPGADGKGEPVKYDGFYPYAFGGDGTGTGIDLTEPVLFLKKLLSLGVKLVCITAGSPYYNPTFSVRRFSAGGCLPAAGRPANRLGAHDFGHGGSQKAVPELTVVGSGYSYLQEWLQMWRRARWPMARRILSATAGWC